MLRKESDRDDIRRCALQNPKSVFLANKEKNIPKLQTSSNDAVTLQPIPRKINVIKKLWFIYKFSFKCKTVIIKYLTL